MRIQFDFDGTLAIGDNATIEDMQPNISAINLCNRLYQDGNTVQICTARGSKSCTTLEERVAKYENVIKNWLSKHSVKYHSLSFAKEYADAYIDDRAYNVYGQLDYQLLDAGFTNNKVTRFNDKVIKVTKDAQNEKIWYKAANQLGLDVPQIYHADKDTLMLEYIYGDHEVDVDCYVTTLDKFSKEPAINSAPYQNYLDKIQKHTENNLMLYGGQRLVRALERLHLPNTFSHGDFSVKNLINTGGRVYMIDPIYDENNFQSYQIDIAKNLFSVLFYMKDVRTYTVLKKAYMYIFDVRENTIHTLMASEAARVATYKKSYTDIANNLIDAL